MGIAGLKSSIRYVVMILVVILLVVGTATVSKKIIDVSNNKIDIREVDTKNNWVEISEDIFVSSDNGNTNMTIVVAGKEAAIIDTGYKQVQALKVYNYIEDNGLSLKYIFITHNHIDHIANMDLFKSDKVKLFNWRNSENEEVINMGDKKFKVIYTGGHTDDHISVELANENILVAGDAIVTNGLPAIGWDIDGFKETLKTIKDKNYDLIIPGHGYIMETDVTIGRHLEYLDSAKKLVSELVEANRSLKDVSSIRVEDCFVNKNHLDENFFIGNHENILQLIFVEEKKESK